MRNKCKAVGKQKIAQTIQTHLDNRKYHYAYYDDLNMFSLEMGIGGRIPSFNLKISVYEDKFVVWADVPLTVNDEEKGKVCEYLHRYWRRNFGFGNNQVRYSKCVFCGEMIPEDKVISQSIRSACMDVEEISGGVIDILYNNATPEETGQKPHISEPSHNALNTIGLEGEYNLEGTSFNNIDAVDNRLKKFLDDFGWKYTVEYDENLGNIYYTSFDFGNKAGSFEAKILPNDGAYAISVELPIKSDKTDEVAKYLCEINYKSDCKFKLYYVSNRINCQLNVLVGSYTDFSDDFISDTFNCLFDTVERYEDKIDEIAICKSN